MIFLFMISSIFANVSAYKKLQIIYTQQQSPQAYQTLLTCTTSVQKKYLSHNCWQSLSKLPSTKNTEWIKTFFKKQCAEYNYDLLQMTYLGCPSSLVSRKRLKEYKSNDIYIDN